MTKPTILIIAGGKNSRFFPLNTYTHKGFIKLLGKPLIVRALEDLERHGFTKIVLVVSQKDNQPEKIKLWVEQYGLTLDIKLVLQPEAHGQGNAILHGTECIDGDFILASPYYTNMGELAAKLWQKKQESGADCVLLSSPSKNPALEGILSIEGERVTGVVEKPALGTEPSKIKVRSVYLFDQSFLKVLQETNQEEYSLEAAYDTHCKTAFYTHVETTASLPSLKYSWHLFDMFQALMKTEGTHISEHAQIAESAEIDDSNGPVIVADGARVLSFARLVGPCYIGKNALVGDYTLVREGSLEKDAVAGSNTEVARSILLSGASIHYSYLADSIVGQNSKIGAGLITANKRLDRAVIKTKLKGAMVEMGTNRAGVITGEGSALGIRVSTMPGVLIGAHAQVLPGTTVEKNIEHA